MKNITGIMSPEMNCAPKEDSYSRSLSRANDDSTSRLRPNTLTSACPV